MGDPITDPLPLDELYRGRVCVWRHRPRGGYGYVIRIPVTVVSRAARRVTVRLADGREVVVDGSRLVEGTIFERRGDVTAERPEADDLRVQEFPR